MPKKSFWIHRVKTESTNPPPGVFTKKGPEIARVMAKPEVSPKGLASAIRMIQFHINRMGKNLSASQKVELEVAKKMLQDQLKREKEK